LKWAVDRAQQWQAHAIAMAGSDCGVGGVFDDDSASVIELVFDSGGDVRDSNSENEYDPMIRAAAATAAVTGIHSHEYNNEYSGINSDVSAVVGGEGVFRVTGASDSDVDAAVEVLQRLQLLLFREESLAYFAGAMDVAGGAGVVSAVANVGAAPEDVITNMYTSCADAAVEVATQQQQQQQQHSPHEYKHSNSEDNSNNCHSNRPVTALGIVVNCAHLLEAGRAAATAAEAIAHTASRSIDCTVSVDDIRRRIIEQYLSKPITTTTTAAATTTTTARARTSSSVTASANGGDGEESVLRLSLWERIAMQDMEWALRYACMCACVYEPLRWLSLLCVVLYVCVLLMLLLSMLFLLL